jgi:hypothetical protein
MERCVEPELLDELPADNPLAVGSRRDLEKINASMGNARIMARTLHGAFAGTTPRRIVEIGGGDGRFALDVARRIGRDAKEAEFVLLDRANAVRAETLEAFTRLGWRAGSVQADVLEWIREPPAESCDAIIANLFLHHFSDAQLSGLFRGAAKRVPLFVAVEPRRSPWCLRFSRLVWLLGCNDVTRHDATVSVRAGFAGSELSHLWPDDGNWTLEERPSGFFSHLFVARRKA